MVKKNPNRACPARSKVSGYLASEAGMGLLILIIPFAGNQRAVQGERADLEMLVHLGMAFCLKDGKFWKKNKILLDI